MSDSGHIDAVQLIGQLGETDVARHFLRALEADVEQVEAHDFRKAFRVPAPVRMLNWRMLGHRPPRLRTFSHRVRESCMRARPDVMLVTGFAPITRSDLEAIGQLGIIRVNFLTDDPFNPAHTARWFHSALPAYDIIFSPRAANLGDLEEVGCSDVRYLQFGYAPDVHFVERPAPYEAAAYTADIVFFGAADQDRVRMIEPIIRAGIQVALYGRYWDRSPLTRRFARGFANASTVRKAVSSAKVTLCLVRQANRDGHSMRTFEVPAMGGCALMERTSDHERIFGPEGDAVLYFSDQNEMVRKARRLIQGDNERSRLRERSLSLITEGQNTYSDRLRKMLMVVQSRSKV